MNIVHKNQKNGLSCLIDSNCILETNKKDTVLFSYKSPTYVGVISKEKKLESILYETKALLGEKSR
jgi:hypothetical protein